MYTGSIPLLVQLNYRIFLLSQNIKYIVSLSISLLLEKPSIIFSPSWDTCLISVTSC